MKFLRTTDAALRSHDWITSAIALLLSAIGFAAIYSVDLSRGGGEELIYFPRQVIAFLLGLAVYVICGRFQSALFETAARMLSILAVALLAGVLVWGQTIRGTTGWFPVGSFSFQPVEFAKAALILLLAALVARVGRRFDRPQFIILSALPTFLMAGLVLLQPDLGSAAVLVSLWIGVLLLTVKKRRYFAGMVVGIAAVAAISWQFFLAPYQRERFLTFFDPSRDPLGSGYNVTQSVIAVGAGRLFGRGLGFGSQSQLRFLPEAQTDFIFSVIAEELGFIGAAAVLLLYVALVGRLVFLARRAQDDFGAYAILGIAWLFFVQMVLNVGAAMGMIPVTGVTLPFLSYGGSSLIVNFFLLGVAQSVFRSLRPVGLRA